MDPDRWQRVTAVFDAALLREPAERAAYVAAACADDPGLVADVHALLAGHERAHGASTWSGTGPLGPTAATLEAGARVGPYIIHGPIGIGGMGEVYRARDTKLGRDVAIKVLPPAFLADADRLARFEREARVLASLNHPHIGAIYGLEEADSVRALVLELVVGETLAERIARGPLPLKEALATAGQMADALDAAHERGIVHRDLKPANIKLTTAGVVKVLDFGIAKLAIGDAASADLAQLPTVTADRTRGGIILGTAAYMSPEQARGRAVDKRTDIWAFGCVLYEMLVGRAAFARETVTDTLAAIVDQDVKWDALPAATPPAVRKLLHRCLAKDPRQRLSDARDARLEIDDALVAPADDAVAPPAKETRISRRAIGALVGVAIAIGVVIGILISPSRHPAAPHVTKTTIVPPAATPLADSIVPRNFAISRDGKAVVYASVNGLLAVRALDEVAPTTLKVTSGQQLLWQPVFSPAQPIFSPDRQWIVFLDGRSLKKVKTSGGPAVTLTTLLDNARGASWGDDDAIIVADGNPDVGLVRVPAVGGKTEVLTTPDHAAGEYDHIWPEALPGGGGVLFTIQPTTGGVGKSQIALLDVRTRERRVLVHGGSHAQYVAPGYLIYTAADSETTLEARGGTLKAVMFDLTRLEVVGTAVPFVQDVLPLLYGGLAASVATDDTLVYQSQAARQKTLVWVDREGREEPVGAPSRDFRWVRLSPDGRRIAFVSGQDLWVWDVARRSATRITFDQAANGYPIWTPDGGRLIWGATSVGTMNVYMQAADGTGTPERLTVSPNFQRPRSITPDGKRVVLEEDGRSGDLDLTLLTLDGPRKVSPLLTSEFREENGELSPDGRWLAYQSNETGQSDIFVRPFPAVREGRWRVSPDGGRTPLWARSGRELFYVTPDDGAVMGVRVGAERGQLAIGPPAKVIDVKAGRYLIFPWRTFDVTPDGSRFLMIKDASTEGERGLIVVQNIGEELKRLLPR